MNMEIEMMRYVKPDMPGVQLGLSKFKAVAVGGDYDFIPSLQERLTAAARLLVDDNRAIIDQIHTLEVIVDSSDINAIIQQWVRIKTSVLSRAEQAPAISTLKTSYIQQVTRIITNVVEAKNKIVRWVNEGEGLNLEHYSDPLMAYDAIKQGELQQQVSVLQAEEELLLTDKQTIASAIAVLQSRTWLDHIKDLLPTAQQVDALVAAALVKKVDAQLVLIAIERITLYLAFFDGGYRLSSLIEARNIITDKLIALGVQKAKNIADVQALKVREAKMQRYTELVEARAYWVNNMTLVAKGLGAFLDGIRATNEINEQSMRQVCAELLGFLEFLRQVGR